MPRISSPRPLDLTKPFVTSSQSYGSQPFDLSEGLVTWYRDIQGDFVPDLSGRGNTARCAGSGSHDRVTGSIDVPEYNPTGYPLRSFDLSDDATSTSNVKHIKAVDNLGRSSSRDDHVFTDGISDISFSLSFWIKLDTITGSQTIIKKGINTAPEWGVSMVSTDRIALTLNSELSYGFIRAYADYAFPGANDGWDHFVMTYDGSHSETGIKIYRNGSDISPTQDHFGTYNGMQASNSALCIGSEFITSGDGQLSGRDLKGKIHSFAIWKGRIINAQEAEALYYAYINGPGGESRSGFISRSPRLLLRELDDHPGSYPTVRRTGDASRSGALVSNFDDSTTIVFSEAGSPVFPSMLPRGSRFNSQAVDIVGQESDISAQLPIRSFQHPAHLHYSPEEEMGPFNEARSAPATSFFLSGTDLKVLPGFNSPLRSKASFTIDITPSSDATFTRNLASNNLAEGQPLGSTNTGFMYYNFSRKSWEQIGATDPLDGSSRYYDYNLSDYSLVGSDRPSGTLPAQFSVSPSIAYAPDDEKKILGYSKIGTPISAFGAPNSEIYHATSSQCLKMSSLISEPFLLEGVRVEFDEIRAQRIQGDSFVGASDSEQSGLSGLYQSGAIKDIDNYVFFMYRQSRKNRVVDSLSDISSSERYLVFSGSMTFSNVASFESNKIRYENQDVNYSLTHTPAFSYDFGLPFTASLDVRLTDWDPSHDTYYFDDVLFDVTSNCVAHFNFETTRSGGDYEPDKTSNGHIALVPVVDGRVNGSEFQDHPTANTLGSIFENGAYISNRGYLQCAQQDLRSPALVIDHASDLQMTSGSPLSIAMWLRAADWSSGTQYIISKADSAGGAQVEYEASLGSGGKLTWRVHGSGGGYIQKVTSAAIDSYVSSEWIHVILSYSGGSAPAALGIFINGVEVSSLASSTGVFTSPVNNSQDVLVGSMGSIASTAFTGQVGSLEFYSFVTLSNKAKKLFLLQETPFLNTIYTEIGQFTGSVEMQLTPATCNRQSFGLSAYSNNSLQNIWLGGTSANKFFERTWEAGTGETYPANPFELSASRVIDDARFSAIPDPRSSKIFGNDANNTASPSPQRVSSVYAANDETSQSANSPYLLLPEDEIIFGIDAGICSMLFFDRSAGYLSNLTGSHLVIPSKACKVTIYGSLIKNSEEFHTTLNQNLSSDSVHEVVGAEPVLDQFQIEPISSYYGSYLDDIVTGTMATPSLGGFIFETQDQDNSRRVVGRISLGQAGTTGSLQRFAKTSDSNEIIYDSCLPDYVDIISGEYEESEYKYRGNAVTRFNTDVFKIWETGDDFESIVKQFPFEGNPKRRVQKTAAIATSIIDTNLNILSDPPDITGVTLDSMNVVFLTRFAFASKAPSLIKPNYTTKFFPVGDEARTSYDLSDGLVSSYFFTGSDSTETLYDQSGLGHDLDLTPDPDLGGGSAVPHPLPATSTDAPVENLVDDGSLIFALTNTDTAVNYVAASGAITDHAMVDMSDDVEFSLSITFKSTTSGATQILIERSRGNNSSATLYTQYRVWIDMFGFLHFRIYENALGTQYKSLYTTSSSSFSSWSNVIVTYDGDKSKTNSSGMRIYVDGAVQSTIDESAALGNQMYHEAAGRIMIGAGKQVSSYDPSHTEAFFGYIHSCHVWKSRKLSSKECTALARAELVGTSNGVIKHRATFGLKDYNGPIKPGTYRYGISNINQETSDMRFMTNHFGYARDILEQRRDTVFASSAPPVKCKFVSGSSYVSGDQTHSQNISSFATSSLPYFDDETARNRFDNPDDILVI